MHSNDNKKLLKFDIDNEKDATRLKDEITSLSTNGFEVLKVVKKERKRQPAKPFITSTFNKKLQENLGLQPEEQWELHKNYIQELI